ncbi:MAG TPA: amidohydrolase family protein [Rubneribacter badeniensis]|uniref:Amidohydrolase family protein n=1 Tax=Rubneribacter badeniensis TaxID=2070688 RepID=A0A9D2VLQ0_9ACTN|nr:amidohydrolase family protein [Rubneribacter badeniensis]
MKPADLILKSTRIFTAEPGENATMSGSIAIADGRIAFVGSDEEAAAYVGLETTVTDLGDAFVCPGFHDSHLHFFPSAMDRSPYVVFCEGTCPEDCVEALKQVEDMRPKDEFMLSYGWYHPLWDNPVLPTKDILDAAYPDRPVCLQSGDSHTLWTNSKGLEKFGITKDSVPPAGGVYQKDENGELTGIIQETAATALIPTMLAFSEEETNAGIAQFLADLNAEGITSVCDVSLLAVPGGDFVRDDVYRALEERGDLTVRINMFPTALEDLSRARKLRDEFADNDLLRSPGLKQFFDGVSSTHTAWLTEPYANAHFDGDCGSPVTDPERMRRIVLGAAEEGFAVRIHTIGDKAIHVALDIFEEAREKFGPVRGQNGLEHLENLLPEDIARLAELDVSANCQPPHTVLDPNGIERDLGPKRAQWMWPYRSYLDKGVKFSFGTDSPVVDINSREVIYDAVTRQSPATGEPVGGWQPQERICAADAIRAYTLGSAIAAGRGDEVGSLAPGKLADIAVLDTDLTTCDPEDILRANVLATYLGGKKVYER